MKNLILWVLAAAMIFLCTSVIASAINPGDANGDGELDNKDVVMLFRFVSGNKNGAVAENCDYNKDGQTDNKDVVALFRALSGIGTSTGTKELVISKPGDRSSNFKVVYDKKVQNPLTTEATLITTMIKNYTGTTVAAVDTANVYGKEIVFSSINRKETADMMAQLSEGEYAVRALPGEKNGDGKLLIAATNYGSVYACIEFLLETYYSEENGFCIPCDLNVKGKEKQFRFIESSTDKKMRDPFILIEDGVYYVYSTGWKCFKNTSGKLDGTWKKVSMEVTMAHPETDGGSHWAPEVHKYNGKYYMFTTYLNSVTNHRGCIILKSDSPSGPFVEITDGFITPSDWDCIDGTFYVDSDGQPWMVFVHEWTCMPDGVGAFAAAKLSDDLTHFISDPIELFRANEPTWAKANITDGCFMYTTSEGELLMLWSNFDAYGYAVGVARSSNGRLDGEWIHEKNPLFSKCMMNGFDGGHGMIFTDTDGQMYLCMHSPNTATDDRKEIPVFLAVEEKDGRIVPVG